MNSFSRFMRWPLGKKLLFLRILMNLYWVKGLTLLLPFSKLTQRYRCTGYLAAIEKSELVLLKDVIRSASKLTFWKNKCLIETFVARKILNGMGLKSTAFLCVAKDGGQWHAHAWITVNDVEIISKASNFKDIYEF